MADCTDTNGAVAAGGEKEPWLLRKTRSIAHLENAPLDSLRVSAADKAHNARDMVLNGSVWYLHSLHTIFSQRLEGSRSVELLGEAVREILSSEIYLAGVPEGTNPRLHTEGYPQRH